MSSSEHPVRSGRVLFIAHALNLSGVSRHMMSLATTLQQRGWTFANAVREPKPGTPLGQEWFESAGIATFRVPFPLYGLTPKNVTSSIRSIGTLRRIIREFRADILHVHAPTLAPYAALAGRTFGIPTVSTLHGDTLGANKIRLARIANAIAPRLLGDCNVAISTHMERILVDDLGLSPGRVQTIFHGADENRFRPPSQEERLEARRAYGIGESDHVVCTIATLDENKDHSVLIRALAHLRRRGLKAILLCAGTGVESDRTRISRLAEEAGVGDAVRLLGHQDSRQVIWASDVSVLASRHEGFGLVTAESMLCQVVPIRTPSAGATDQVADGKTGFLIPFDADEVLADRLEQLFSQPALRATIGTAAQEYALARFTTTAMASAAEQLYVRLLASRHEHAPADEPKVPARSFGNGG